MFHFQDLNSDIFAAVVEVLWKTREKENENCMSVNACVTSTLVDTLFKSCNSRVQKEFLSFPSATAAAVCSPFPYFSGLTLDMSQDEWEDVIKKREE